MTGGIKSEFQSYNVIDSQTFAGVSNLKADLDKIIIKEEQMRVMAEADREARADSKLA